MRKALISIGAAAVLVALMAGTAVADGDRVLNGSFEDGTYTSAEFTKVGYGGAAANLITDWPVGGDGVDWLGTGWTCQQGDRCIDLNASPGNGSVKQTFEAVGGAHYTVFFWMAGNPSEVPSAGCYNGTTKTMSVDASNGGSPMTFNFNTAGQTKTVMGWKDEQYDFSAAAGGATTVTFLSTAPSGNCGPAIDNVTIFETLPTAEQCKKDGWRSMVDKYDTPFKNQGDCVSYFATGEKNLAAG